LKLLNKYTATPEEKEGAIYIGRGSPLGNPWVIGQDGKREEVIARYRPYLEEKLKVKDPSITKAFQQLRPDSKLLCFCTPKPCHGEVIINLYNKLQAEAALSKTDTLQETVMSQTAPQLFIYEGSPLDSPYNDGDQITARDRAASYRKYLVRKLLNRDAGVENAFRSLTPDTEIILHGKMKEYHLDVLFKLQKEILEADDYETALHRLKENHSLDRIDYHPREEGVTHINILSRAKTELGQILSNFAKTPFDHPEYGHFSSVEGFWYWLSTGKQANQLRSMHGFQSKKYGRMVREELAKANKILILPNFEGEIKHAIFCKITQNPHIREMLRACRLPLTHYYTWGEGNNVKISYPEQYAWIHEYIQDVRDWLNGKAQKLIIAGSRKCNDFSLVEKAVDSSGFKPIMIISGCAPGADRLGERYAEKWKLPLKKMPADWDQFGKRAGFERNGRMADEGDAGVLVWDGESPGTKNMQEELRKREKPCFILTYGKEDK
jgi:hypothetical protein